ncbi:MAG: DUF2171 domain-containing protein [Deltaproteobacteria bacterium]|nr:DUF2171 domain-containing protein [Deltaproteobacteria bacterium]
MADIKSIKPHMSVVGSDNVPIGRVDHLEGDNAIKLTRDRSGQHHFIPAGWVSSIDDKVHLNRSCNEAMSEWRDRASLL